MKKLIFLLSLMISDGDKKTAGKDEWKSYSGSNFTIKYKDFSDKEVKEISRILDAIQKLYVTVLPELQPQHDFKCTIKLFDDVKEMNATIKKEVPNFQIKVNGVYIPIKKTLYTIPENQQKLYTKYHIIMHEFFHFYTDLVYDICEAHLPGWIKEGLAVYFAGIELDEDKEKINRIFLPESKLIKVVKNMQKIEWKFNLKKVFTPFETNVQDYTLAWSLCKFLIESDSSQQGKYRKFFGILLEELKEKRYDKALKSAFDQTGVTYKEMTEDWKKFMLDLHEQIKKSGRSSEEPDDPDESEETQEDSQDF
ncbi:MAG: hypothetical protein HY606_01355 [Planctomycetes bacterium]|nr:hypothetical protein [Planctomycetota bacterium]